MDTNFSHDGPQLQLPESGPVALSLSDMLRFQALREAYPTDQRYHWTTNRPLAELAGNPCHGAADPLLMLHYEGGRPVAGLEAVRDRILFDGQPYEWMWLGNQLTLPECRGRGLMVSLFNTVKAIADERGISIGGAGTTPAGRASYLRNGFKFLGYAPRQCLILRANGLIAGYIPYKKLAKLCGLLSNGLLHAHRAAMQASLSESVSDFHWTLTEEFDADVSPLFDGDPRYPRFVREREKMQWRWNRSKGRRQIGKRDYRLGFLRAGRSGELAGFLMLRLAEMAAPGGLPVKRFRVVTVLDWAARYGDRTARRAVVSHAVRAAQAMGGEILEFTTTDTDLHSILRHRVFIGLGGYRMFYYGAKGTPFAEKEADQLGSWWWNGCDPEDAFTW